MDSNELDIDFSYSDFDDRIDPELNNLEDDPDEQEHQEEEDSFYRNLEEY
ncbi:hypothetical protein [Ekhidna sp.]